MSSLLFLEIFVSLSLQALLLVLLTAFVANRRNRPQERDRLWTGCQLGLLMLTLIAGTMPHLRIAPIWTAENAAVQKQLLSAGSHLAGLIFGVWVSGAGLSLLLLFAGILRVRRFLRTTDPLPDDLQKKLLFDPGYKSRSGLSWKKSSEVDRTRILVSPSLHSPFCWQLHRPVIVLPESSLSLPDPLLRLVVRHEQEHLRSGHPVKLFVQRLVEAVFWFHPAVWWASRQADLSRELRSDASAVESREEAALYLRGLLSVLSEGPGSQTHTFSPAGLRFGGHNGFLAERARCLAERNWDERLAPQSLLPRLLPWIAVVMLMVLWIPVNVSASRRSIWSPWPSWSARILHCVGIEARDYEIDGHRLYPHSHRGFHQAQAADPLPGRWPAKPSFSRHTP